jgi:hypothetical protein
MYAHKSIRETEKNPKNPLVWAKKNKKTQKKPKKPKKNQQKTKKKQKKPQKKNKKPKKLKKNQKKPTGLVFFYKNTGFFPTLNQTNADSSGSGSWSD